LPFTTWPDRTDVPRNAARPLRYIDRFVTVTQGEVFYATQVLAELEGLQRGPAGNTSLAAAFAIARELDEDRIVVVQETEYTGAGKHPLAQLDLAKRMGIEIKRGNPRENRPGRAIVIPEQPSQLEAVDVDLDHVRRSYLRRTLESLPADVPLSENDVVFLAAETRIETGNARQLVEEIRAKT
jgi:hypothetical protein